MGLFDDLRCRYPLPLAGANDLTYQTKDLNCYMDQYEIREDGTLWHEEYDVEDRSDPNAEGIFRLCGAMSRVNKRWEPVTFTGEVCFYSSFQPDWSDWIEWSAYFVDGALRELHLLRHDKPEAAPAVGQRPEIPS